MLLTNDQIQLFKKLVKQGKINVITFDLETSPSKFWGWGTGEQYVDAKQLVQGTETKIITAQYTSSLSNKYFHLEWKIGQETRDWDDSSVVKKIVNVLNSADIVIAQNGKAFDIKVLQERAKVLRLPPVYVDFMLDTLTSSRSSFKSMSHRLDYRSKQYGMGGKHKMEFQDWINIVEGRVSPKKKMVPYGIKDIKDTDKLFWLDLPYYNLAKTTVNKILKLISKHQGKKIGHACKRCSENRKSKYNTQLYGKNNLLEYWECLTCFNKWEESL